MSQINETVVILQEIAHVKVMRKCRIKGMEKAARPTPLLFINKALNIGVK